MIPQARNLSAADSNGASDPYVVVRFAGQSVKTATRFSTTNPVWYQTLTLTADLLPLKIAPKVSRQFGSVSVIASGLVHVVLLFPAGGSSVGLGQVF
jgi:hypothetical protein